MKSRHTKSNKGKKKQSKVSLPAGWLLRLRVFCEGKGTRIPYEEFDLCKETGISRRTLSDANKSNKFTTAMFAGLVSKLGFKTADDLLTVLRGPSESSTIPGKVVSDDNQIPDNIQEKLDLCHEWLSNGEYTKAQEVCSVILAGSAGNKLAEMAARIGIANSIILGAGDIDQAKELLAECLSCSPEPDKYCTRSSALYLLGAIEWQGGRIDRAYSLYSASLTTLEPPKHPFFEANILMRLVHAAQALGRMTAAHAHLDRLTDCCLTMFVSCKGENRRAAALNLGQCYLLRSDFYRAAGQHREAIRCVTHGEPLFREGKDPALLGKILLSKAETCLALEREDDAFVALDEAEDCFSALDNARELIDCSKLRIAQAKRRGDIPEVIYLCGKATTLAAKSGDHGKHILSLLRMAGVYRLDEQTDEFRRLLAGTKDIAADFRRLLASAKDIAATSDDAVTFAACVLVEVDGILGDTPHEQPDELLRDPIDRLSRLADTTESPVARAGILNTLGCCYSRVGRHVEARTCIAESLHLYQTNGRLHESADCFLQLATSDKQTRDFHKAAQDLNDLLEATRGKPMFDHQREARARLVPLMIQLGDFDAARKHQEAYLDLCGKTMSLAQAIVYGRNGRLLTGIEESLGTPSQDLSEMLRQLHSVKDRYPDVTAALLPFWYRTFTAQAMAHCRAMFGVKFLVAAPSAPLFEHFAAEWQILGDLFIYAADLAETCYENQFDVIPWPDDFFIPPNVVMWRFPKDAPQFECTPELLEQMLDVEPYFLMVRDTPVETYPDARAMVVGRRRRVSDEVSRLMLEQDVATLLAKRSVAMPVPMLVNEDYLHTGMCVAYSYGFLPVFIGAFPAASEIVQERAVRISLSAFLGDPGRGPEGASVQKKTLRRFMSEVSKDPDAALVHLVEGLEPFVGRDHSPKEPRTVSVLLLKFQYGRKTVIHPAFIVETLPSEDRNSQVKAPKLSRKK